MPEPASRYIEAWLDELPEHPLIADLRANPGRWAVLNWSPTPEQAGEAWHACKRHPQVETDSSFGTSWDDGQRKARWLP